ncbi:MAG: bile acid:sodium symporter [Planctomycetota bacterium]
MATLADRIRRHFLWLLLACYALAAVLPGPGDRLANWHPFADGWLSGGVGLPIVLVAVLLLLAAASTDIAALRVLTQRPWLMGVSLAAVWLGPVLAAGAASFVTPLLGDGGPSGLLLGLALVAAMPVANSSVGWTQQSGGNLAWSLGLVVLSILLCPWVTPSLLRLAGLALTPDEASRVETLVTQLTGITFIVWVLLPTAVGLTLRQLIGGVRIDRCRLPMQLTTAFVILLLNYLNGARVVTGLGNQLPSLRIVFAAGLGTLALSLIGVVLARALADTLRLDAATHTALRFGLSMKHTGLALGLAASIVGDQPVAGLVIAIATPMQHLVASLIDRWVDRGSGAGPVANAPG